MGRSSLHPSASTPSGSAAPSLPRSPPSSRCGSPRRSTTSLVPLLFTASASEHLGWCCCKHCSKKTSVRSCAHLPTLLCSPSLLSSFFAPLFALLGHQRGLQQN